MEVEALADATRLTRGRVARSRETAIAAEELGKWNGAQRGLQNAEFSGTFREWVDKYNPRFSYEVARALALAALESPAEIDAARRFRVEARARVEGLLEVRRLLCFPTTPILPPHRDASVSAITQAGDRIVDLTCIAGLTGLPQLSLPFGQSGTIPVGLSLLGWRGADRTLLAFAQAFEAALGGEKSREIRA